MFCQRHLGCSLILASLNPGPSSAVGLCLSIHTAPTTDATP